MIENFIAALGEKIGSQAVTRDNECQFTAEMQDFLLMIHVLESSRQLLLSTCVAEIPAAGREKLYLALLQGQYFFQMTSGASLAVDNEEKFITLQIVLSLDSLTADSFLHVAERFMHTAEYWRGICLGQPSDSMRLSDPASDGKNENEALSDLLNNGIKI